MAGKIKALIINFVFIAMTVFRMVRKHFWITGILKIIYIFYVYNLNVVYLNLFIIPKVNVWHKRINSNLKIFNIK